VPFTTKIHVSVKLCYQSARRYIAADAVSILTAVVTYGIAIKSY